MKKKFINIICIFLFTVIMVQPVVFAENVNQTISDTNYKREGEMNSQLNNLMQYFIDNGLSTNEKRYPDFYAGGYINDDRTSLVICVTDDSLEVRNMIIEGTKNPKIIIEKVQYPLNFLITETKSILTNYNQARTLSTEKQLLPEITSVSVSVRNNGLEVGIKNYNQIYGASNKQNNRSVSNEVSQFVSSGFSNISYYENDYCQDNSSYDIGTKIASTQTEATMGHRGKAYDPDSGAYVKGFWTAGHATRDEATVYISSSGVAVGSCLLIQNQGSVDAAFIKLLDQSYCTITNDLTYDQLTDAGSILSNSWFLEFAEGAYVYMNGAVSGTEKGGMIQNTYYSYTLLSSGVMFSDMLAVAYTSINGDSGACVYSDNGVASGDFIVAGIHKGIDSNKAIVTKMYNIVDTWNITGW